MIIQLGVRYGCRAVRTVLLMLLLSMTTLAALHGFTLQPMSQGFSPEGAESSRSFRLHNPGSSPIAIELSMLTRKVQPDGSEIREAADDLFSIFPSRVVLEPGEQRTVRVRWIGPEEIEQERAFRLLADQLPVSFDEEQTVDGGVISISFRYLAAVYITPPNARSNVHIRLAGNQQEAQEDVADSELDRSVIIELENTGTAHRILHGLEIRLTLADSSVVTYSTDELKDLTGHNLLAGAIRRYRLDLPDDSTSGVEHVEYSLSD